MLKFGEIQNLLDLMMLYIVYSFFQGQPVRKQIMTTVQINR